MISTYPQSFFSSNINVTGEVATYAFGACIVPRKTDSTKYNFQQDKYLTLSGAACKEIMECIKNGHSFQEILAGTGLKRKAIAKELKMPHASLFGVLRTAKIADKISTDLLEEYKDMLSDLQSLKENDPTIEWDFFTEDKNAYVFGYRIGITHTGQRIRLSKYMFFTGEKGMNTIGHTSGESLEKAKEECEYLYKQIVALDSTVHASAIKTHLAQLHWWQAQAAFYFRGSAACSEIITGALTCLKFESITPYKLNVFADRIALTSSCEEFVNLYPSLRENCDSMQKNSH